MSHLSEVIEFENVLMVCSVFNDTSHVPECLYYIMRKYKQHHAHVSVLMPGTQMHPAFAQGLHQNPGILFPGARELLCVDEATGGKGLYNPDAAPGSARQQCGEAPCTHGCHAF